MHLHGVCVGFGDCIHRYTIYTCTLVVQFIHNMIGFHFAAKPPIIGNSLCPLQFVKTRHERLVQSRHGFGSNRVRFNVYCNINQRVAGSSPLNRQICRIMRNQLSYPAFRIPRFRIAWLRIIDSHPPVSLSTLDSTSQSSTPSQF